MIERAVILSERSTLPVLVGSTAVPGPAGPSTLAAAEREQNRAALTDQPAHSWAGATASVPGLKPTTPESRIEKLGVQRPR